MTRRGTWLGLITALCGFAVAHVLVQGGSAMQLPVPTSSVTVPPVPAPALPVPPPPTPTTPTVSVPPAPTPTVPVPPAPKPPVPIPVPAPPVRPAPPVAPGVPSVSTSRPSTPTVTAQSALRGTAAQPSGGSQAPGESAPPVVLAGAPPDPSSTPTPAAGSRPSRGVAPRATTPRALEARRLKMRSRVSVQLRFSLPKADRIFLIVRGPTPSCRIVGYIPVRGRKGVNKVAFVGRVNGRRLEPGTYLISLSTSRRLVPDAATEYVRVVSARRSLPLPDSAPTPSCSDSSVLVTATRAQILLAESLPAIATPTVRPAQPTRPGRATPAPSRDEDDAEASSFIPDAGVLGVATDAAADEPFVAIAVLSILAALLIAMFALVTKFIRGSWNP
jgi:hypothetical protein